MMFQAVEMETLRQRLESRFGLKFQTDAETVDGGVFPVIRPAGIERGTGFCIVVARTHRQIEASFRADNFAAGLLRRMSEAEASARATFETLASQACTSGAHVYAGVNGNPALPLPSDGELWKNAELDVSMRLPAGTLHSDEVLKYALEVTTVCLSMMLSLLMAENPEEPRALYEEGLPEGARVRVEVNRYERSPANRAACIAHFGTICQACGFDFLNIYGEMGEGYIEVHHRIPVSQLGGEYFVNPVTDLVPLCGNCHAMVHRITPPVPVEALRAIVEHRRSSGNSSGDTLIWDASALQSTKSGPS